MLVIALQFYTGDWYKAMKLARLLADLETCKREDVALLFVRTTRCAGDKIITDVMRRCSGVFPVEEVVIRPDTPERRARWNDLSRWPVGCNVLWQGAAEHFLQMDSPWTSVFTVDGGDGVPLYRDWIDLLARDHQKTLDSGLLVTGDIRRDGIGRWHVNGNLIIERSFLADHPEVLVMPETLEAWDTYYSSTYLPVSRGSSAFNCGWRQMGLRPEFFPKVAEKSVWWHGFKDGHFVDLARDFIFNGPAAHCLSVVDRGRASDIMRSAMSQSRDVCSVSAAPEI